MGSDGLISWPAFSPDGAGFDFSINGRDNPVRQLWDEAGRRVTSRGPDYVAGSVNLYVVSFGVAANLHNGNTYFQLGLGRSYPGFSYKPGFSLVAGNVLVWQVNGKRVDKFLNGGGLQVSSFMPTPIPYLGVGGSLVYAYGGDCGFEYGFGTLGASVAPVTYGKRMK